MSYLTTRIVKQSFWAAVLFICTSYTPYSRQLENSGSELSNGTYEIKLTGDFNSKLKGKIYFETATETSSNGTSYATLKLDLRNKEKDFQHSMGFLVSKQGESKKIALGRYKVAKDIDGFLNYFDGVFGFANVKRMGELPFFADKGVLAITYLDKHTMSGNIKVNLKNSKGQRVYMSGNFIALKQKQESK
ncbi:MAG: hypothetical protein WBG90_06440 [Saonia sp.]